MQVASLRKAYGETLVELGRKNKKIVVLDADLAKSTHTYMFGEVFPDRFFAVSYTHLTLPTKRIV